MLIKRLAAAAVLCTLLLVPALAEAAPASTVAVTSLEHAVAGHPALANPVLPTDLRAFAGLAGPSTAASDDMLAALSDADDSDQAAATGTEASGDDIGKTLIALAMKLRDIRYVRGGKNPSTGFDCSGFVRYVFSHAIGLELPGNSAAQFLAGLKVKRGDMQAGDLVFFHTHGRGRSHVSHVGIYIDNGRFIHSPSAGKSVEVSSLDEAYWAKRFVGARRPEGIAQNG